MDLEKLTALQEWEMKNKLKKKSQNTATKKINRKRNKSIKFI